MSYLVSGLLGFVLTLLLSLPIQHLMQIREARISIMSPTKSKAFRDKWASFIRTDVTVSVAPLPAHEQDSREPRIKFLPQYPREAAEQRVEGYVILNFSIASDGSVQNLKVLESNPPEVFDNAARRAVAKWNFRPAKDAKENIDQKLRLNFNLKKAIAADDAIMSSL